MTSQTTHRWYSRPVLFVSDIQRALHFYVDLLGFEKQWHEGDGAGGVCQVTRSDCEIILCEHDTRKDKARLFVELTADGLTDFRREVAERSIPSKNDPVGVRFLADRGPRRERAALSVAGMNCRSAP